MLYNSFCWPAFQDSPLMVWNETTLQHHNTLILTGSLGLLFFFFFCGEGRGGGRGLSSCNREPLQERKSVHTNPSSKNKKNKKCWVAVEIAVRSKVKFTDRSFVLYYMRMAAIYTSIDRYMLHRDWNWSGWSGHGQAILSRSWDKSMRSTFVRSRS